VAGQRAGSGLVKRLLEWSAVRRPAVSKSTAAIEEAFLWGYQTAQRSARVPASGESFAVGAGMLLNTRRRKVLGWYLTKKDGKAETLIFKDAKVLPGIPHGVLLPVVKKKKKPRKTNHA